MHAFARRFALLAAVLSLVVVVQPSFAQRADAPEEAPAPTGPTLFSLDFPGGTLRDFANAVRRANVQATLIVDEIAANFRLPALEMRQVDLETAGAIVEVIANPPEGRDGQVHVHSWGIAGSLETAVAIRGRYMTEGSRQTVHVWSLAEHLQAGMNADDLLSGVEAAVGAVGDGGAIRFHAPTAMLIVRGGPDQVSAADQAVGRMLEVGERSERSENNLRANLQAYQERLLELEAEARIGAKRVEIAQMRAEEVREQVDSGLASEVQFAEAELEVVAAEAELQQALRSIDRLGESIRSLRERLDD